MEDKFEAWAILELMGHRRLAGKITESTLCGGAFIRIDIPGEDGKFSTQFYSPASVYCLTPTTEELARAMALNNQPAPVSRWELPQLKAPEVARFEQCSYRFTCQKGIMCQDCEVYAAAMEKENQGSEFGEEDEEP